MSSHPDPPQEPGDHRRPLRGRWGLDFAPRHRHQVRVSDGRLGGLAESKLRDPGRRTVPIPIGFGITHDGHLGLRIPARAAGQRGILGMLQGQRLGNRGRRIPDRQVRACQRGIESPSGRQLTVHSGRRPDDDRGDRKHIPSGCAARNRGDGRVPVRHLAQLRSRERKCARIRAERARGIFLSLRRGGSRSGRRSRGH